MAFLDEIGTTMADAAASLQKKAKDVYDTTNTSLDIHRMENRKNELFQVLGRQMYLSTKTGIPADSEKIISEIADLDKQIEDLQNAQLMAKGALRCPHCGAAVDSVSSFCTSCGNPLPKAAQAQPAQSAPSGVKCPNCGSSLKEGTKFCTFCGTPLANQQL